MIHYDDNGCKLIDVEHDDHDHNLQRMRVKTGPYAGNNVLVDFSECLPSNEVTVYPLFGYVRSFRTRKGNLVEGWTPSGHPKTF